MLASRYRVRADKFPRPVMRMRYGLHFARPGGPGVGTAPDNSGGGVCFRLFGGLFFQGADA